MQEIGNFNGNDPLRTDEEQTNWGLYIVTSSPLILGNDLSIKETMDRIWPTITNTEALAINADFVGHPGTLVRSYPATDPGAPIVAVHGECDGSAAIGTKRE